MKCRIKGAHTCRLSNKLESVHERRLYVNSPLEANAVTAAVRTAEISEKLKAVLRSLTYKSKLSFKIIVICGQSNDEIQRLYNTAGSSMKKKLHHTAPMNYHEEKTRKIFFANHVRAVL